MQGFPFALLRNCLEVLSMLLQPLVENSVKHRLEPKVEGGSVKVSLPR